MTRTILFLPLSLLLCILPGDAEAGTILSSMGVGAPAPSPSVRSMGMGGISIAFAHPMNLSRTNPAASCLIDRSLLSAQYLYENNQYRDGSGTALSQYSNFEGFNFGLPLGSGFGIGFGLAPLTRVDYHLSFEQELDGYAYAKSIEATGGLNTFELSVYGSIQRFLSIGLTGRYIFGQLEETWSVTYEDVGFEPTEDTFSAQNGGFGMTAGLLIRPTQQLSIGAVLSPPSRVDMQIESENLYDEDSDPYLRESRLRLPSSWGVGITYRFEGFGTIGAEYEYKDWSLLRIGDQRIVGLNSGGRFGLGCEIQTRTNPLASFFSRMAYRFGFSYQPYFAADMDGRDIRETWFTVGLGVPLFMNLASVDMSFSYGFRGSLDTNGLEENLFRIAVSVTAGEKWFVRRY